MDQAATQAKIRKQVEFYFSDSNLPFDKFLWTLTKKNDGWVPIKTLADFKKMKMITEDFDTVVAALKAEPSELLEVNEEQKIRRKTPIEKQDIFGRSIYAKPFAVEKETEDKTADLLNLQDEIQDFFEQYGKVLAVRMRKEDGHRGAFKGSKVAAMDLEYKGTKLETMTKEEYHNSKAEKYKDAPVTRKKGSFNAFWEEENRNNYNKGGKRGRDSFKAKDKKNDKRQRTEEEQPKTSED
ncbi:hypothetical protein BCR42DRAFT_412111 [Absidia repens]|uniref:HTH La-type RNA-binding domain-containing protein n=1 Tax=Absidia repens TaxID=90262 RepID=A0A1X2IJ52_9FUNG|nr:hypothetical protein BCR42DRAFT_412111 [Absidia repens]